MRCSCRFGGVLHDWPEGYFKAQQSKGNALAGIFKQAMNQHQAHKISITRSIISRMFSGGSALARLKSLTVWIDAGHLTFLLPVLTCIAGKIRFLSQCFVSNEYPGNNMLSWAQSML